MKSDKELRTKLNIAEFELLVPASNKDIAKKAILTGADAIYAGYSKYGARVNAGIPFSDLIEIIEFAHTYDVKVYITLNTILNDIEILKVEKLIKKLYEIKADGVIIQDMGILELDLPPIPLIASTQCNNNSIEKIKFLEKTGFKRVILPRELSIKEIQEIRKNTNIELECFIHGALCMSYSGQCYMSYVNGGRSANRGNCAQPCRKRYSLIDSLGKYIVRDRHILSLKDLNLSKHLEELILSGVTSFKIEGRLKNESYVINTTAYYRQCIDRILENYNLKRSSIGSSKIEFIPDLNKTFNRGYTEFNFSGNVKNAATIDYTSSLGEFAGVIKYVKKNYFSLNTNILNNGDGICFFDKYKDLIGTNINKIEGDKVYPSQIEDINSGISIYRNFDKAFDDKIKNGEIKRQITAFLKIKETNEGYWFFLNDENENCAVYGISKDYENAKNKEMALNTLKIQMEKSGNTEFKIRVESISLNTIPHIKVSKINEIRRILADRLKKIRRKNYKNEYKILQENVTAYPYEEIDYTANVYNKKAELFYKKRGVKIKEFALEKSENVDQCVVMTSKYCLKNQFGLCPKKGAKNKFKEPYILKNEFNKKYLVEFDCKECKMKILKSHDLLSEE